MARQTLLPLMFECAGLEFPAALREPPSPRGYDVPERCRMALLRRWKERHFEELTRHCQRPFFVLAKKFARRSSPGHRLVPSERRFPQASPRRSLLFVARGTHHDRDRL